MRQSATTRPLPRHTRTLPLADLGLLEELMLILDVTVVALALPSISADLGLGRQSLTWVVSGYTLAFGGLLLLGGRAGPVRRPPPACWSAWGCSRARRCWPGWP